MKKVATVFTADTTEANSIIEDAERRVEAGEDVNTSEIVARVEESIMKSFKVEQSSNIAFVGEKPLVQVNAQGVSIDLPKDQSKPFYCEQASFLIRHFPHLYKPVVPKGDK